MFIGQDFSGCWTQFIIKERLIGFWNTALKQLGAEGVSIAGYWQADRIYTIPAELTKSGKLNIAIRVMDLRGDGGIQGFARLVEKVQAGDKSPMPYYTSEAPLYDTETSKRW